MVDVPFTKSHGLCNDYFIVERGAIPDAASDLAVAMCDRRTGVGADGLIVIGSGEAEAASFRIFNADGSEAELCGNGLRCAAVHEAGGEEGSVVIESAVGRHRAEVMRGPGGQWRVAMDLVPARIEPDVRVVIDDEDRVLRVVMVGNPHAILPLEVRPDDGLVGRLAAALDGHERFPDGVNVHIVWPGAGRILSMSSWERGVGPVLACATGAAASVVASGNGCVPCEVEMPGGVLSIELPPGDAAVRMEGPVVPICEGVYRYVGD